MNDVRALAAAALADVAIDGASLREVTARALPRLRDARDRALLTALVSEGARWWLRFDAALSRLLERPLPKREAAVHALLVLGLVQIETLGLPAYAAVGATVEATRALRRDRYAGVANAVLRRWQRERETLMHWLDADATTRHAFPRWLLDAIARDWPGDAEAILVASNAPATPTLRVNRRRGSRESLLTRLAAAGYAAQASSWLADAVMLDAYTDITRLPGFAEGAFSVQDGAAQLAADLLDARDGMRVLDACAAPGGKAAHVLERAGVELIALDIDAARLARVGENFARLGLAGKLVTADAAAQPASWWDGRPFERILLDAPCSATGVIRRHPDIKLHRRAGDIAPLAAMQGSLLARLWPMLAPGGRLLYATCSLLREENEQVVGGFLAAHGDAHARTPALARAAGAGWQLLPGIDGVDGMFYAVLDKAVV
jgi:16S rRNA (cytosine967-C5)-methyltransferase